MSLRRNLVALPALAVVTVAALAMSGCASSAPASDTATAQPAGECAEVTLVVNYGVLDAPVATDCIAAGPALDAVTAAGLTIEGTAEYGDQVVCRVDGRPGADETVSVEGAEPFVEGCESMPAATAYWALWVKTSPDAEWEYAQEGIGTLVLDAGESVGLVYTTGTETTPPSD